jgi:hypothetical protein
MQRALLVMKMNPADAPNVARVFTELDRSAMPANIGVTCRTLFHYHGLYFHLVESPDDIGGDLIDLIQARHEHADSSHIAEQVRPYLTPYVAGWRELKDSRATEFYRWQAK